MSGQQDTIAAIATAPGRGGIGIVRISGHKVPSLAEKILGRLPKARYAHYGRFFDEHGEVLDDGIALYFPGPNSYTGEDVLELQGHGGPVVLDAVLRTTLKLGARLARPGEFTERAFLNGRLDLAQAEAVVDLIDASSQAAARAAMRALSGEFSRKVDSVTQALIELRMYIESELDFPEEEIDFLADERLHAKSRQLLAEIDRLLASTSQGVLLREGMRVAIVGRPNTGKSSLLNRLAGEERAIVTDIPGTTRDVLHAEIQIDGLPVHVIDTAGLRESDDPVEQEGIRRAWVEIEQADAIILMVDDQKGITDTDKATLEKLPPKPLIQLYNKIDLTGRSPGWIDREQRVLAISARQNLGLDQLRQTLKDLVGYQANEGGQFIARRRHLDALQQAREEIAAALIALTETRAGELAAESLRRAQLAMDEITGKFTADDLLGKIFSSFCIGK
ncbi:MAG TPA: tRNA uridine-5-carboxymethylaminomethyl(34) synthesis GTPase MnmE [Halothiobacillus sp.]|nr:tRNA uridine-5-carboxymethylaminomethyl(34) synthesis GTPase MnmE [Halothiobacillus sp.]